MRKSSDAQASWYNGQTLVEELDTSEPVKYALDKPLRLTISDVFRGGAQNPLSVSGRLEAGSLQTGDQVQVMPSAEKAFIRSLEVDDEPRDWAVAGQNVVINLTDIDQMHLKTGDLICSTTSPVQNITSFMAKVLAFEHLTPMNIDIHRGRLHVPGKISQLVAILDKSDGTTVTKKRPKIVQPGSVVRVMVKVEHAVPLPEASRIVLRANGGTIAAGLLE
jgi:elongation factor 1 alpha-like protein